MLEYIKKRGAFIVKYFLFKLEAIRFRYVDTSAFSYKRCSILTRDKLIKPGNDNYRLFDLTLGIKDFFARKR